MRKKGNDNTTIRHRPKLYEKEVIEAGEESGKAEQSQEEEGLGSVNIGGQLSGRWEDKFFTETRKSRDIFSLSIIQGAKTVKLRGWGL